MGTKVSVFRASTAAYQGKGGLDGFREELGRTVLRVEMTPVGSAPLHCDVAIRMLPDLAVATGSMSPLIAHHPESLGDDGLVLVTMERGAGEFQYRSGDYGVRQGQALLTANDEGGTLVAHTATHMTNIRLRRDRLATLVADPFAALGQAVAADHYALRLLRGYVGVLTDPAAAIASDAEQLLVNNVYDLVALSISGVRDVRAHRHGLRAARLHALKTDIRRNIAEPRFSIADLACRHGISGSYVRRLFAENGTSFADYLVEQRLQLAYRLLSGSAGAGRTISSIAYEVGFGDLSYFNRTFKRRFGMTPSDLRALGR